MAFLRLDLETAKNRLQLQYGLLVALLLTTSFILFGCSDDKETGGDQLLGDPGSCEDTPGWTNGVKGQNITCAVYAKDWCNKGTFFGLGWSHNYPEKHCCGCGKESSAPPPTPVGPATPPPTPPPTSAPGPSPTAPPTSPPAPPSGSQVDDKEWEHFQLWKQLRAAGFTCPDGTKYPPNSQAVEFDCRLWRASYLHSQDMADNKYFSHTSQDGRSPWDRASAQGVGASGENIAAGSSSAQGALDQWKGSNGHCRGMMGTGIKIFAVGYGYNAGAPYRHYWTQMFGGSTTGLDTSCHPNTLLAASSVAQAAEPDETNLTVGDAWVYDEDVETSEETEEAGTQP